MEKAFALMQSCERRFKQMIARKVYGANDREECHAAITLAACAYIMENFNEVFNVPFQAYVTQMYSYYIMKWLDAKVKQDRRFVASSCFNDSKDSGDIVNTVECFDDRSALEDSEHVSHLMRDAQLTPWEREILRLRYDADLAFADIAAALDYPDSTIRRYHEIALEKLRRVADAT